MSTQFTKEILKAQVAELEAKREEQHKAYRETAIELSNMVSALATLKAEISQLKYQKQGLINEINILNGEGYLEKLRADVKGYRKDASDCARILNTIQQVLDDEDKGEDE